MMRLVTRSIRVSFWSQTDRKQNEVIWNGHAEWHAGRPICPPPSPSCHSAECSDPLLTCCKLLGEGGSCRSSRFPLYKAPSREAHIIWSPPLSRSQAPFYVHRTWHVASLSTLHLLSMSKGKRHRAGTLPATLLVGRVDQGMPAYSPTCLSPSSMGVLHVHTELALGGRQCRGTHHTWQQDHPLLGSVPLCDQWHGCCLKCSLVGTAAHCKSCCHVALHVIVLISTGQCFTHCLPHIHFPLFFCCLF